MNFKDQYLQSVKINRMVNMDLTPEFLIPNLYQYNEADFPAGAEPLHLLAGGSIRTEFPVSVSFRPFDSFLLLYTSCGGGKITYSHSTYEITEKKILAFDYKQPFTLQSFMLPWNFKLFFVKGRDLEFFLPLLRVEKSPCFFIPEFSTVHNSLSSLLCANTNSQIADILLMHRNLSEILSSLCLSLHQSSSKKPSVKSGYLPEMQDYLEHHYSEPFSLEKYEELFHISRYRLCREFSGAFGLPPLKYLTSKRMEAAKKCCLPQTIQSMK